MRTVSVSAVRWVEFTRLNRHGQNIFTRRQRTGCIGGERAGRVVGLVEIDDSVAILMQLDGEKTGWTIGLLARRSIAEDDGQLPRYAVILCQEMQHLALAFKLNDS